MTFGTASHVNPYFPTLSQLVDEGNQVTFFAPKTMLAFSSKYPKISAVEMQLDPEQFDAILHSTHEIGNSTKTNVVPIFKGIVDLFKPSYHEMERFDNQYHPDLFICDIFHTACVEYANAKKKNLIFLLTNIGSLGVGESWYTPSLMYPVPQEKLVKSIRSRIEASINSLPSLDTILPLRTYMNALKDMKKELHLESTRSSEIIKRHLVLTHNVIGLYKARELPTNVITIGPMLSQNIGKLDDELQIELDQFQKSKTSVIYIAFGSGVNISGHVGDKIFEAVELLLIENHDIAVVWALGKSDGSGWVVPQELASRLLFKKWVNQRALLGHPSVTVFCTHGGIASLHESMYAGKPVLVTGMFGDQFLNAIAAQEAKIGLENKKMDFTPNSFKEKIVYLHKEIGDKDSELYHSVQKMKKIVELNMETHQLYAKNLFEMAATVGYDHLVPITSKMTWWQINGEFYTLVASLLVGFLAMKVYFL